MTGKRNPVLTAVAAGALAAIVLGAGPIASAKRGALPQGSEVVELDPAAFTTKIDNPYFPLRPGDLRVYRKTEPDGSTTRVVEEVTDQTKVVANGVTARVVHVLDYLRGEVIEETFDWYAQDTGGNVWYLGEDTQYYDNGVPVPQPDSWESGVDGAQPGVVMPGRPKVGMRFRQEYYADVARDRAEVLALGLEAEVPRGHFEPVLLIGEGTPLEPKLLDLFFFARGVGRVLGVEASGGAEREELIRFKRGPAGANGARGWASVPRRAGADLPVGAQPVDLNPAEFTTRIDNPYFPLRPHQRSVYRNTDLAGTTTRSVVEVTGRSRKLANGVRARVVRVLSYERGKLVERTLDYYAQDRSGSVWYLGERKRDIEHGVPVRSPESWQAGRDGARPGVMMPARPKVGMEFRHEHYAGVAEDRAEVLARGLQAEVPRGHFDHVLLFSQTSPLEPRAVDLFFFARGVGRVLAVEVSGGTEREELVRFGRGSGR